MNRCIYSLNDEKNSTFNKREHIIPAGLGGRQMLNLGYVSDDINESFSKLELVALRYSWLSINRKNNGPGKRGSSNVLKIKNPVITINKYVKNGTEKNPDIQYASNRLGFIFYGKLYTIPQIIFPIRRDNSIQIPRILLGNSNINDNNEFIHFIFSLYKSNLEIKYIKVDSKLLFNENFIIIGMFNKKTFIFTTKDNHYIECFLSVMKQKKLPEQVVSFNPSDGEYSFKTEEKNLFDDSYIFIYVKTAFNALAFLQGQKFVLREEFNYIRESILKNTNLETFTIFCDLPEWLKKWASEVLPLKAHYVVISAEYNLLNAFVGFYGETPMKINLTNKYNGKEFKKFIICDYLNNNEYSDEITT